MSFPIASISHSLQVVVPASSQQKMSKSKQTLSDEDIAVIVLVRLRHPEMSNIKLTYYQRCKIKNPNYLEQRRLATENYRSNIKHTPKFKAQQRQYHETYAAKRLAAKLAKTAFPS